MNWRDWSPWRRRRRLDAAIAIIHDLRSELLTVNAQLNNARDLAAYHANRAERTEAKLRALGSVRTADYDPEVGGVSFRVHVSGDILRRGMANHPTFRAHMVELFEGELARATRRF